MLGLIVSGRLVQTDFTPLVETKFFTQIADADNINHVVVFLTGQVPLPEGMAGLVYFSWPDPNAPPNWQYLGHISNMKPSAIFKISSLKKLHEIGETINYAGFGQQQISHSAQIGVSIEPASNVPPSPLQDEVANNATFAQKMVENLFNYISSFAVTQAQMVPNPTETFVPLSSLQNWYANFERRLMINPNFWKN